MGENSQFGDGRQSQDATLTPTYYVGSDDDGSDDSDTITLEKEDEADAVLDGLLDDEDGASQIGSLGGDKKKRKDGSLKVKIKRKHEVVGWMDLPRKGQLTVLTLARLSEPLVQTSLQVSLS